MPGACGASVTFEVSAEDACGCPEIVCTPPSGSWFDVGGTAVNCTATDTGGNSTTEQFEVSVVDVEPPVIHGIESPLTMWPPDHGYRTFSTADLVIALEDNCTDPAPGEVLIRRITSDEPENGNGDGNTMQDIVISADGRSVLLRSERQGGGNGRIYTIHLEVADAAGNVAMALFKVHAVDDRHGHAIDDGISYSVEFQPSGGDDDDEENGEIPLEGRRNVRKRGRS
jgi:hypothetical protein